MDAVTDAIRAALAALPPGGGLCVALSGGLDSSVLLHALAGLRPATGLRAVYVDHGLHADAGRWGERCAALCAALDVPFSRCAVKVVPGGEGIEAAAREARYRALLAGLHPGETLLTAHHLDDQAETLLLNLMRGSGPAGLAGITGAGWRGEARLLRPLLALPRAALRDYAHAAGLEWIEDPANTDARLDRNFLRMQVLPLLAGRWPAAASALGRSARLCAEAAQLLDELAAADARRVSRGGRVRIALLAQLTGPRQRNLLRHLCRRETGSTPPQRRLNAGLAQLLEAGSDRQPLLAWSGGELRRYRGSLYIQPPLPAAMPAGELPVRAGASLDCGGAGRISLVRARSGGLAARRLGTVLTVRQRRGGERLRPAGEGHRRELKKLLQERGVVPWMRDRIPLLYAGEELVAVAGLWIAHEFVAAAGERGLRVRWDRHPGID
ncbi:MAG: tRNA lysidine(34) synthetase TilS [Gammaproteobacteria bacterium]|nr:MAG: tRNA lysidine(34) synthetase TilS [Gammaproteobacteria bacterium]